MGVPTSHCDSSFRGLGVVVGLWANKKSWGVPTSHCDSGFKGLWVFVPVVGLWANKESWGVPTSHRDNSQQEKSGLIQLGHKLLNKWN